MKIEIDQARIAAALAALRGTEVPPMQNNDPVIWTWARMNGKTSYEPEPQEWPDLTELAPQETGPHRDRYFLNNLVEGPQFVSAAPAPDPAGGSSPLEDILSWMRIYREADLPRARRLHAGDLAVTAFTVTLPRTCGSGYGVTALTGVPIVRDPDLPDNAWKLVDAQTGDTIDSGTIGASIEQLRAVIDQFVDQLAEQAEIPRRLLDYY